MTPHATLCLSNSVLAYVESRTPGTPTQASPSFGWSIDSLGVLYGSFLVERMRSYDGRYPLIERHLARLSGGAQALGLDANSVVDGFRNAVECITQWNKPVLGSDTDVGLAYVVTPDESHRQDGWRAVCYLSSLPYAKLQKWYSLGMDLGSARQRFLPDECIPTEIKHRSRMHYFLADRQVKRSGTGELALLQSIDGYITDTSVANIILVDSAGGWSSPKQSHCGVTLRTTSELLAQQGVDLVYKDLTIDEMLSARERILVGTTGCVWGVGSWDGQPVNNGEQGALKWLQSIWANHVQLDFVNQAVNKAGL